MKALRHPWRSAGVAAAMATLAGGALPADIGGYVRVGTNPVPAAAAPPCVGLASPGLRYRLGNECDSLAELTGTIDASTASSTYAATVTPSIQHEHDGPSTWYFDYEQAFVSRTAAAAGDGGATQWIGRRRDWEEFYLVDSYFVDMSGEGIGASKMRFGDARWSAAAYRASNFDTVTGYRVNLDADDWHIGNLGKLRAIASFARARARGDGGAARGGAGVSLELVTEGLLSAEGRNEVLLQASTGAVGLAQGFARDRGVGASWRVLDMASFQQGRFGGQLLALVQREAQAGRPVASCSTGGRFSMALVSRFKALLEVSHASRTPQGLERQTLDKGTAAIAMSPAPDFWSRPELRLFWTAARYNLAASRDPGNSLAAGRTGSHLAGLQVETWF